MPQYTRRFCSAAVISDVMTASWQTDGDARNLNIGHHQMKLIIGFITSD